MNISLSRKKLLSEQYDKQAGFTLIEVMIALTIFAVGLLALAGMQVTGMQGSSKAQSVSAKVALTDSVIEEFLVMDGSDPRLTDGTDPWYADVTVDLDGAGVCSIERELVSTAVTGMDLSQLRVRVSNPLGADVEKLVLKRWY